MPRLLPLEEANKYRVEHGHEPIRFKEFDMEIDPNFLGRRDTEQFRLMHKMIYNRVFASEEKGMRRHGKGLPLWEQPAFQVRPNSPGFFTGQAQKKIIEGSLWEGDEAEGLTPKDIIIFQMTEYIDAIAYLTFELMFLAKLQLKNKEVDAKPHEVQERIE